MRRFIEYFDLGSIARARRKAFAIDESAEQRSIHWFPQYLALVAGILVQPFFQKYMATGQWDLKGFWGWAAGSAVVSAMAFPGVYKRTFDAERPLFVQLCVIFTAGTGWQTLVSTALKAAGVAAATNAGVSSAG
jgi:hypothetical protein